MVKKTQTEKIIQETVEKTIAELVKQNIIKTSNLNAFKKTEQLLYNYNNFKEVIKDKQEMIDQIKNVGLTKKSTSILPMPNETGFKYIASEDEKKEDALKTIEASIDYIQRVITNIDNALKKIEDDPYYKLIELCYFKNLKYSVIADKWKPAINEATVSRNKNRLVKKLSFYIFSDEYIKELYS